MNIQDAAGVQVIRGNWTAGPAGLTWQSAADRSVVFVRSGIRVIVELQGDEPGDDFLVTVAGSIR